MLLKSVRDPRNVELKKIAPPRSFGICSSMNDEFWISTCDSLDWILIHRKKRLWEHVRLRKVAFVFLVRELNKLFTVFTSSLPYLFPPELGSVTVLLTNTTSVYISLVTASDKLRFTKYPWFFVAVTCKQEIWTCKRGGCSSSDLIVTKPLASCLPSPFPVNMICFISINIARSPTWEGFRQMTSRQEVLFSKEEKPSMFIRITLLLFA